MMEPAADHITSLHSDDYYTLQGGSVLLLMCFGVFVLGVVIYALWRFIGLGK